ncbi:uncharacterized protein Nmag_1615 [Natrialba magadii ATCC 43099]|uniref:CopG family transcriptional regulator n=1 Tax=Natrialba magadii (strain ATCC 43099 / DSM 3394 / CCM 3739 / CIP 104546 / IAM 13178 / JCM 8861 / NBRC 102185 / NCIMB 2190 / MS3) TaxID=547559 RepID=D3SUD3_NATMM|nr:hypothetical protein [Natrialba magadii]ADD05191.1 uncharacterized protein Nmag_1615 [Natrialba magadii ATCC 43099]ELY23228.1 hypothetical protein C500_20601 [Natrialba magadii ATCC 43099]
MTSKRDKQISTYVTGEEKQDIRVLAAKQGYSGVSDWLRDLALEELEEAREEGNSTNSVVATAN